MLKANASVRFKGSVFFILLVFLASQCCQALQNSSNLALDHNVTSTTSTTTLAPEIVTSKDVKHINTTTEAPHPAVTEVSVTQIPLLGVNGSGILKVNVSEAPHKVSEPIHPDYTIPTNMDVYTPERIKADHNISNVTINNHEFYNSSFIGNVTYFNEYWANITKKGATVNTLLSNSHRKATMIQLGFMFPFYGYPVQNITLATGGFIHTGEHVHNWLAATQYIAPLMANFDTSLNNDSHVKFSNEDDRFTAFWENVSLQEDKTKKFTFAVTLYKNGDIVFAYKNVPIDVNLINDSLHPVKVGISDAYLSEALAYKIPKLTIYHYVTFKKYEIKNSTVLWLKALPACVQYESCDECLNHNTTFNCVWCDRAQKCSSKSDKNKKSWDLGQCSDSTKTNASMCLIKPKAANGTMTGKANSTTETPLSRTQESVTPAPRRPIGGAVVIFVAVTLLISLILWVVYAFKNPHTRSGQFLIKYRPSQWSWRRGEARYTAATIHM